MSGLWTPVYDYFGGNAFNLEVIGTNVLMMGVFWFWGTILILVDLTGKPRWMLKYRTQPANTQLVELHRVLGVIRVALRNQLFIGVPASVLAFWVRTKWGAPYGPDDLPSALVIVRDITVYTLVEEILFYYTHRLQHWGPMYVTVHKTHHEWQSPIAIASIYAHPAEYAMSNSLPFLAGPVLMNSHLATSWIWYSTAISTTIIYHSGYHLPWLPSPEYHDYHHLKYTGNYGVLGWLDWLHGTDQQFRNSVQCKRDHLFLGLTPVSVMYPDNKEQTKKQ